MKELETVRTLSKEIKRVLRDWMAEWIRRENGDIVIRIMRAYFSTEDLKKVERIAEKHGLNLFFSVRGHCLLKPLFGTTEYLMITFYFKERKRQKGSSFPA
jgi:hypothetical protein